MDSATLKVMFSSESDEHSTPQDLFDELNREFRFTLDVCATPENAKCDRFFTREQDGLRQEWRTASTAWCNPPYGSGEKPCGIICKKKRCAKRGWHRQVYLPGVGDWVKKACDTAKMNQDVVMLLPARTDTKWFHKFIYKKPNVEIRFIEGRLTFGDAENTAPFPSMIVIFRGYYEIPF